MTLVKIRKIFTLGIVNNDINLIKYALIKTKAILNIKTKKRHNLIDSGNTLNRVITHSICKNQINIIFINQMIDLGAKPNKFTLIKTLDRMIKLQGHEINFMKNVLIKHTDNVMWENFIKFLIDMGVKPINSQDPYNELSMCIRLGNTKIIKMILGTDAIPSNGSKIIDNTLTSSLFLESLDAEILQDLIIIGAEPILPVQCPYYDIRLLNDKNLNCTYDIFTRIYQSKTNTCHNINELFNLIMCSGAKPSKVPLARQRLSSMAPTSEIRYLNFSVSIHYRYKILNQIKSNVEKSNVIKYGPFNQMIPSLPKGVGPDSESDIIEMQEIILGLKKTMQELKKKESNDKMKKFINHIEPIIVSMPRCLTTIIFSYAFEPSVKCIDW